MSTMRWLDVILTVSLTAIVVVLAGIAGYVVGVIISVPRDDNPWH